jgi:hypothetical protein
MSKAPAPRVNLLLATVVTIALMTGWLTMYFLGVFDQTGKVVMFATLGTDLMVIGAFWFFATRNDLNRRP